MRKRKISKNRLLIRLLFLIVFSILVGSFYLAVLSKTNRDLVGEELTTFFSSLEKVSYSKAFFSSIFTNSILFLLIWIFGISMFGIPIVLFLLIYKSFILGFSISSILYFYRFKGIFIALIYIIPFILQLFAYFYLGYYSISSSKKLLAFLFKKKEFSIRFFMRRYVKIFLVSFLFLVVGCVLEIFVVPSLIQLFL